MERESSRRNLSHIAGSPASKTSVSKNMTLDGHNTSKSPKAQQRTRQVPKEARHTGIPHNVNFYRHLISEHDSTDGGVEWALQLRSASSNNLNTKIEPTGSQPFAVGEKTIKSQEKGKSTLDLDNKNELHKVSHLFLNRIGATPTRGSVIFETGLRSYGSSSTVLKSMEKKWNPIAKKDRKDDKVMMYPSYEETRDIRAWTTKNNEIKKHMAFDGLTQFPKYEIDKKLGKNLAEVGHLFTASGTTAPMINWQLSMRNYENPNKLELPPVKELGELKKINRQPKRI